MVSQRARGAVFTPEAVARRLAEVALDGRAAPRTVCDPAAGDGRLLRAVAAAVVDRGGSPPRSFGADLHESAPPGLTVEWAVADTLVAGLGAWADAPGDGFDLVIGNPPFRAQLQTETALTTAERAALAQAVGSVAKGYADTASMFLVRACEMAASGGRVALIMPLSYLAARDAAASRRRVLELATLDGIWIAPEQVFPDADVRVCALILDRAGPRRRAVRRWVGETFEPVAPIEVDSDELATRATWGHLTATAFGVPEVELDGPGRLGDLATATAGFRQQFYGLAPLVVEHPGDTGVVPFAGNRAPAVVDGAQASVDSAASPTDRVGSDLRYLGVTHGLAPLVTSGLIEPGRLVWGERPARMAKTTWRRPAVDLDRLDPESSLGRWVAERRRPKLLVATQTRVVEAAPDPEGVTIPSTPVIAVHVDGPDLWQALAVLLAPPVTAWALTHFRGAALSADAVKLSASQVLDVPLPPDADAWNEAATTLAEAHRNGGITQASLLQAGELMTTAYRCDADVTTWWTTRL